MQLDPIRVKDTREWMQKSREDWRRCERLLSDPSPDIEDALFHSQQAVEKAFKAFLTWHDEPFGRTHDLRQLSKQCAKIDPAFQVFAGQIGRLTQYAWVFRYPSDVPEPTLAQASDAASLAREVVEAVLARLPDEVQP